MTMRLGEVGSAIEEVADEVARDGDAEDKAAATAIRAFGALGLHIVSALDRIADALEGINGREAKKARRD